MVDKTFHQRIEEALEFYGLIAYDLAILIKSNSKNVEDIIKGEVGLGYAKMVMISDVFGLKYYEFGNPKKRFLPIQKLDISVQKVILERRGKGIAKRDKTNSLAKELDRLILEGTFDSPITASKAFSKMNLNSNSRKSTEVTNLLNKEPRNNKILRLKNKIKNNLVFIHKDFYDDYKGLTKAELIELIGE
ncbi:hypothetical protein [Myroides odoratimimus]|uniref:hypothetical protein n=1 Tax=Myroides odoratimimus TaxID=76832 RepID=UPI002577375D|nr:hypothetical protein [Myroides odoratimimus]MDM1450384.1 hypothetical protein [Myroides odoratimimus]